MAKDPATLWYWNDWNSGTVTFSRHLKGCYMDLLHAQFNNGHLSLDEIKTVLGVDFSNWNALQKKFAKDENGSYYNERLEQEITKRRAFSESRRNNRTKKICSTSDSTCEKDMSERMENENINENINNDLKEESLRETILEPVDERISDCGGPSFAEVKYFFVNMNKRKVEEAITFWNEYESKNWIIESEVGPPRAIKRTKLWQLKAEQWIQKARLTEIENEQKGNRNGKQGKRSNTGATDDDLAKITTERFIRNGG
jgi:uncharacterized protein YdaU (DUF1376 family)